jgi:hypothetical protein
MRVRVCKAVALGGGFYAPGALISLPEEQAERLIAAGVLEHAEIRNPKSAIRNLDEPPADRMIRRGWRRRWR